VGIGTALLLGWNLIGGGIDYYHLRAIREKATPKEEVSREPTREAINNVVVGAKELLVLEVLGMIEPLDPRGGASPLKRVYGAALGAPKATLKSSPTTVEPALRATTSHALGPGLCNGKP